MPVALVTGGSAGLGRALVHALAADGWSVVTDARNGERLAAAVGAVPGVTAVPGDVTDPAHRAALGDAVRALSPGAPARLDLLVQNASTLGPLPLRPLRDLTEAELLDTWRVNAAAPAALATALRTELREAAGTLVAITSDAAAEHYETWGAYAAGKAALEHLTLTFGAEEGVLAYAVDPGDLRTQMHQDAFPGEDISDRPLPETAVPALLALLRSDLPAGRYRLSDHRLLQEA